MVLISKFDQVASMLFFCGASRLLVNPAGPMGRRSRALTPGPPAQPSHKARTIDDEKTKRLRPPDHPIFVFCFLFFFPPAIENVNSISRKKVK